MTQDELIVRLKKFDLKSGESPKVDPSINLVIHFVDSGMTWSLRTLKRQALLKNQF